MEGDAGIDTKKTPGRRSKQEAASRIEEARSG